MHRDEEMEVLFGVVGLEFCERAKCVDGHNRHYRLEHLFQPQSRQGIGIDDCNLRSIHFLLTEHKDTKTQSITSSL